MACSSSCDARLVYATSSVVMMLIMRHLLHLVISKSLLCLVIFIAYPPLAENRTGVLTFCHGVTMCTRLWPLMPKEPSAAGRAIAVCKMSIYTSSKLRSQGLLVDQHVTYRNSVVLVGAIA